MDRAMRPPDGVHHPATGRGGAMKKTLTTGPYPKPAGDGVTEPRNILRFSALLTLGGVPSCVAAGACSGGPEPFTVAAFLCGLFTAVCWAVPLFASAVVVAPRSIRRV